MDVSHCPDEERQGSALEREIIFIGTPNLCSPHHAIADIRTRRVGAVLLRTRRVDAVGVVLERKEMFTELDRKH